MALLDAMWSVCGFFVGFFFPETDTSILIQSDCLTSVIVGSVLLWVTFDVGFCLQCRGKVLGTLK